MTRSLVFITIGLMTASGWAGPPVKSPECQANANLQHPDNSRGVVFDQDCKTAYVLPPLVGEFSVDGFTASEVLDRCPEVDEMERQLLKVTQDIGKVGLGPTEDEQSPRTPRRGRIPRSERSNPEPAETGSNQMNAEDQLKLVELLKKRKDLVEKMYSSVGSIPGANISLGFTVDTMALVQEYKSMNTNANVTFLPVTLSFSALSIVPKRIESADFPITHSSNRGAVPGSSTPDGKRKPSRGQIMVNFSGSSATTVTLSLFGACKLRDPLTGRMPKRVSAYSLRGMVNVVHEFDYELQTYTAYKATYNLGALARTIKENSTSGGFFKTSSVSKVTDERSSNSWFRWEDKCDDSTYCRDYNLALQQEVKTRLVKEVLQGISLARMGPQGIFPDAGNAPANGAGVAADGLRKCANVYCQIGAVVLDVLNASFGEQSKTDSYIATHDHWAGEESMSRKMIPVQGTLKFDAKR